jgi:hypothetical protein
MNRVPAVVAAVFYVAAAAQLSGTALAFDILDGVGPRPAQPAAYPLDSVGPPPAPPPSYPPPSYSPLGRVRLEGGLGYNSGARDMSISTAGTGSLSTSLIGGDGIAAEAALWADDMVLPSISLGAQYLYLDNSGSVTASSLGGPIVGLTSVTSTLSLTTNAVMFNAAWRPTIERIHPFLGAGVGVAFTTLSGSALGFSASSSQTDAAAQVFLGFDYDLTPNIYTGVTGRFFISDTSYQVTTLGIPTKIDVTNRPISLMAHLGVRF